jgi:hypothetical protein
MTCTGAMDRRAAAVATAVVLLSASCASEESCTSAASLTSAAPVASSCPDLRFGVNVYTEWRDVDPPRILQEVGNASYPACNDTDACDGRNLDGFGATDVWLVPGVDPTRAVIGLREGTHTYVIFVKVGVDPGTLRSRIDPDLLA